MENQGLQKNNLMIPIAIIIAGLLISIGLFLAIYLSRSADTVQRPVNEHLEKNIAAVTSADHIKGSPSAPVTIIEYSDTDCYFCNLFKPALDKAVKDYGESGQVSLVYRHFNTGIPSHPHTLIEAKALECVADLGNNEKFWQYLDLLFAKKDFEVQPNKLVEPNQLPSLASSLGINQVQFATCLGSNKFDQKIADMTKNAQESGARGTPYSVVTSKKPLNNKIIKFVEDTNNKYIGKNPIADIVYVSEDKKMVVLGGAVTDFLNELIPMLVELNSK